MRKRKTIKKNPRKMMGKCPAKKATCNSKVLGNRKREMQMMMGKIEKSYKKLNDDVKKHAPYRTIEKDNNELLMLLGECNYIVREFHLFQKKIK